MGRIRVVYANTETHILGWRPMVRVWTPMGRAVPLRLQLISIRRTDDPMNSRHGDNRSVQRIRRITDQEVPDHQVVQLCSLERPDCVVRSADDGFLVHVEARIHDGRET